MVITEEDEEEATGGYGVGASLKAFFLLLVFVYKIDTSLSSTRERLHHGRLVQHTR